MRPTNSRIFSTESSPDCTNGWSVKPTFRADCRIVSASDMKSLSVSTRPRSRRSISRTLTAWARSFSAALSSRLSTSATRFLCFFLRCSSSLLLRASRVRTRTSVSRAAFTFFFATAQALAAFFRFSCRRTASSARHSWHGIFLSGNSLFLSAENASRRACARLSPRTSQIGYNLRLGRGDTRRL